MSKSGKKPLLVLVDGSALFHRGYHAIPHLSNKDGIPTNAVYGFALILLKVIQELKPEYAIITWDKSSDTFRKDMYPEYKAHRVKQPEDLYAQIPTTHELVDALALPWVELDKFEADDIIGTLARQAEKRGDLETVIVTGDKDQLQLVDENTVVDIFNPSGTTPTRYDLAKMQERYQMTPTQFIDYKALVGDKSDNIPGVAGIGDVGARKLIAEYHNLDGIYAHLDDIPGKTGEYLAKSKEIAYLSHELSKIVLDAPVTLDLEPAKVGNFDRQHIHDLFRRLEFRSLLAKLPPELSVLDDDTPTLFDDHGASAAGPKERPHLANVSYRAITTMEELDNLVANLAKQKVFAFDTETTSVDTFEADLVGISLSWKQGEAYYIPVGHTEGTQLETKEVLAVLKAVFENPEIGKVGHNIKFDLEMMIRNGIRVQGVVFDTMVAAFLINSLGRSQSLDDLAYGELGIEMIPITELIGKKGKDQVNFDSVAIETATTYAAEDADISWRLYQKLKLQLESEGLDVLGAQMEWPLIPILAEMELTGIELDVPFLQTFAKHLNERIGTLKAQIYDLAGEEFNLSSPAQLAQILYGRLGLSTVGLKKGKTGFSTAAGELEKLRETHPIISLLMEFRELEKLRSTYVEALPDMVKSDGRIHTSFNQTIAQTGRLSSTNPNLQNIPVRTELGREIRQAFVASKGRVLVSADYSQIELRVAAALAHDQAMIETFKSGVDLHRQTAAELYGLPIDEVSKDQRGAAKTINFGVLYGMSAHGLSVATGMDQKEASEFIKRYFEVRPKLAQYIEETKKFAYDNEYTATLFGRRRACPEIRSNNFQIRSGAERMAVNVPIQGTAADIYKLAMIAVHAKLDPASNLLLQIHDELIVETDAAKGSEVAALLKSTMESVYDLGLPLAVDVALGKNWGEL
jgi:DNA polymerase-1